MTHSEEISTSERTKPDRKLRVRLIVGALVLIIFAALILTPPYINVNRYRRRIGTTMSQSLGRPVHLDNVTLHLLPVPGLTLSNLVVSEDAAFGYEPVIRANTVEATLRASSLWRRHIEFSTIRFIDPSVNLVRNAQGRWNLEDVLMQASHVETAPTAQRSAGPSPRFPYIEATGARVNVKVGEEKKPFSLTEAEFALWLPSPQLWRVRLRGRPTRTDSNVSQAGEMNLEGSLQRALQMANVPIDIHVSWNEAPLGEASRLLTGNDAGWRGTGFVDAHVAGELSAASLITHLQLNDLRRADFVPAQPLDVAVDCSSTADVARAELSNVNCTVPVSSAASLTLSASAVDLNKIAGTEAKAKAVAIPVSWVLGWTKLMVAEMPSSLELAGGVDGELDWNSEAKSWQGALTAKLPDTHSDAKDAAMNPSEDPPQFVFAIDTSPAGDEAPPAPFVRLAPTTLHPGQGSTLTLAAQADSNGYGMQLNGVATNAQVMELANTLPPLNEGVGNALSATPTAAITHAIALTCSRLWGAAQTCSTATPVAPKPLRAKRRR